MKRLVHRCGVCLAEHILDGRDRLPRHGWKVFGAGGGRGHEGATHSGPCPGVQKRFPHLGRSVEGAAWQLDQLIQWHARTEEAITTTLGRPTLHYLFTYRSYDVKSGRRLDRTLKLPVEPGAAARPGTSVENYGLITVPSYNELHERRLTELRSELESVKYQMATYQRVVSTWAPSEPYYRDFADPTVHLAAPWRRAEKLTQLGRWNHAIPIVPLCMRGRSTRAHRVNAAPTTENPVEVTCQRCRQAMAPQKDSIGGTRHIRPIK